MPIPRRGNAISRQAALIGKKTSKFSLFSRFSIFIGLMGWYFTVILYVFLFEDREQNLLKHKRKSVTSVHNLIKHPTHVLTKTHEKMDKKHIMAMSTQGMHKQEKRTMKKKYEKVDKKEVAAHKEPEVQTKDKPALKEQPPAPVEPEPAKVEVPAAIEKVAEAKEDQLDEEKAIKEVKVAVEEKRVVEERPADEEKVAVKEKPMEEEKTIKDENAAVEEKPVDEEKVAVTEKPMIQDEKVAVEEKPVDDKKPEAPLVKTNTKKERPAPAIPKTLDEITGWDDSDFSASHSVARGVSGVKDAFSMSGATRGHVECDVNIDSLVYWNKQGPYDEKFESPFSIPKGKPKYITFVPDCGGWNNIRMSMEIIFVIAAVTGRILVLPPKAPLYLLQWGNGLKYRGFGDFFPLDSELFQKHVKTISMKEFIERDVFPIPKVNRSRIEEGADYCEERRKCVEHCCVPINEWLADVGVNPNFSCDNSCLIFDVKVYHGALPSDTTQKFVKEQCGQRQPVYWNKKLNEADLIHFRTDDLNYRLLAHFYNFAFFTNPKTGNHFKRFVRDFLHYRDSITCAAGKVVKAVQHEASLRGFLPDENGAGGYSSLHIRRGDLQFKEVKIPASEWYNNTKELYRENEILYVATDERNKTFFKDLAEHHDLRYLDDYKELAGLGDVDPSHLGMIDTIVASRGRVFVGTWFSTFSGYINRLRGYHGLSMKDSWYSFLPRKNALHEWVTVNQSVYAFEYPDGWVGIDGDEYPKRDIF